MQLAAQFLSTFVGAHAAVEWASKDLIRAAELSVASSNQLPWFVYRKELNEERMSPLAQWHWAPRTEVFWPVPGHDEHSASSALS